MSVLRMFFVLFLRPSAKLIGRIGRGFLHRRRFLSMKWAALRLQVCIRRFLRNRKLFRLMTDLHKDLRSGQRFSAFYSTYSFAESASGDSRDINAAINITNNNNNNNDNNNDMTTNSEAVCRSKMKILRGFRLMKNKWLDFCTVSLL